MPIFSTFLSVFQSLISALSAPLWLWVAHPIWKARAPKRSPWVISGHRGRAYLDNAAALEATARAEGQSIIWIANAPLDAELAGTGVRTLRRHSWAARRAISRAPVLVYSHGEDDLDLFLIMLRGRTAPRFYLNHCMNLLKAGGVLEPGWQEQSTLRRLIRQWLLTDCDHLLAASEVEKKNFARSYPKQADKIVLGGGAHLDGWERALRQPPQKRIYWFPTFRDSALGQTKLREAMGEVLGSERLRAWLVEHDFEFFVGVHINADFQSPQDIHAPFHLAARGNLVSDIAESQLLISDYSGIVFDYLLSERPQILFAVDREEYLRHRCLYVDYDALDFALHITEAEKLVDAIVDEHWRAPELNEAATRWRGETLPSRERDFALATLNTIRRLSSSTN